MHRDLPCYGFGTYWVSLVVPLEALCLVSVSLCEKRGRCVALGVGLWRCASGSGGYIGGLPWDAHVCVSASWSVYNAVKVDRILCSGSWCGNGCGPRSCIMVLEHERFKFVGGCCEVSV